MENMFIECRNNSLGPMKRIISFDVGIKNLAYCIIDIESGIRISDWAIINLTCDDDKSVLSETCSCVMKKGGLCGKLSKYHKNDIFYCEKHAKKCTEWMIPSSKYSSTALSKCNISQLNGIASTIDIIVSPNLNAIKRTKKELVDVIVAEAKRRSFISLNPVKVSNTRDIDLITIGRNIKTLLDNIILIKSVTCVLIENQIGPLALRMKSVQGLLSQYFIMRFDNIPIFFISSSNKLKNLPIIPRCDITVCDSDDDENQKLKYKQHKSDAVHHTHQIIADNPEFDEWKILFPSLQNPCLKKKTNIKKLDDYADCFLQALWWLSSSASIITVSGYKYTISSTDKTSDISLQSPDECSLGVN